MSEERGELEPPTRFSRSLLWRLQRASYQAQGPLAWRPGGVPMQVTSNPFIARGYAAVIAGLVRDLRAAGALTRPLRIVELGAGSGRFGFFLARALAAAFEREGGPPAWRLIMTDLAERNLAAWAAHPKLRPFIDAGVLDVAQLDAERPGRLSLRTSGEVIDAADDGEPVVAIANYLFDSIPHDVVRAEGGVLHDVLVALEGPGDRDRALVDPAAAIEAASWRLAPGGARTDDDDDADPAAAALCREYAATTDGAAILLPTAAFSTLDVLARMGGGRLLVLTSDKGHRELALKPAGDPLTIVRHAGCVSLSVNFHALARWCELRGGFALPAEQRHDALYTGVLALGLDPGALPACLAAVDELERFGPGDYQRLIDHTAASATPPTIEHALTLLRLGSFDPRLVDRFAEPLVTALRGKAPDWLDRDLERALERALDLHYAVPGQRDELAGLVGAMLYHLRRPARAIVAFEQALDGSAADALTHVRLALCWLELGRIDEARAAVTRALALAPDHAHARQLAARLDEETAAP